MRKWGLLVPLFPEGDPSRNAASLADTSRWAKNLPTLPFRLSPNHYFHVMSMGSLLCLLSKRIPSISGLFLSQACWLLELQALSPAVCKNSWNLTPLAFLVNYYGDSFPPVCSSLCFTVIHHWSFLSTTVALSVSLPNCVSVLPVFFSMASFLLLVVEVILPVLRSISGISTMIW